ncbi:hypothetical protein V2J09_006800 [Rumex salicifolius]
MHGREDGENRKRSRHMWSVASRGSTATVGVDSGSSSVNSFLKDGRKITVGDCALFKPPNDSPPFIGFIRSLSLDKDNNLKLRVNWLYRPTEVVLGKGVALEAAPNEVFYSFHRDETLAASLLHPCKVAFLPKGAELPSGISSFVCRRVYDITNKCLWWLTDKDYINDRQEEVDQLLQKSRSDMHPTVHQHQGTNSPKSANGAVVTSPLKHSPDSTQNNGTYASHPTVKKRDLGDQSTEPMKRERLMKDGGDPVLSKSESSLKSEISKITDKGGLVDYESVEKVVQLMQAEKLQKKVDFGCRSMLAGIIACTDRFDCLNQFVLLRGLPVLDGWLQEVNKGKIGYSGSPKDGDKSVEDFLFVLLRALDKLPVNLNALQTCNIGKSVNNLRSHKNLEIQKKARSLVDMWKKRVEFEMNIKDSKSNSNQVVPWPGGRSRNDATYGGNKHPSVSSETATKSSGQLASTKSGPLKLAHGDTTTRAASVHIANQTAAASMFQMTTNYKDGQVRISPSGGVSELPQTVTKEEKSSSSSHSHTNSQCSSDLAKNIARSGKEDPRSSTAGSKSVKKTSGSSRHRKSANDPHSKTHSGGQKESLSNQNSSLHGISPSEKFSESTVTSENNGAASLAENNSHKIIVKIPNRVRSPGQVANTASTEDPSCRNSRASSPVQSEKFDQSEPGLREKKDGIQTNEDNMIPASPVDGKQCMSGNVVADVLDVSDGRFQSVDKYANTMRSVDSSMSSMNALIESCVKYSEAEAPAPLSIGDDSGMNLLASVATGEITRSGASSPAGSPPLNTAIADNTHLDNEGVKLSNEGEPNRPIMSNDVQQQNGDLISKYNVKLDKSSGGTFVSVSTACVVGKYDKGRGEQICANLAVTKDESHVSVTCPKQIENGYSSSQDEAKGENRCKEALNRDQEGSLMQPSSDCGGKSNPNQELHSNASVDHKPTSFATNLGSAKKDEVADSSGVCEEPFMKHSTKQKTETTHDLECCSSMPDGGSKRIKLENNSSLCSDGKDGSVLASADFEEKAECNSGILGSKERGVESHLRSKKFDTPSFQGEKKDDCAPCIANTSSSTAIVSDDRKLEFDLNEGFDMDGLKYGEPTTMVTTVLTAPASFFGASQCANSSVSSGLPASITVASAAKRPFVPPEDLLRNKSELGWKGSAATSAFRPAEPRKVLENHTVSNRAPLKEPIASKPVRPFLDIDLNLTDEMGMEDMGYQDSFKEEYQNSDRKSGGLELDLNKVDDSQDLGHRSVGNFQRFEVSVPPVQSSNSNMNSHMNSKRNFDLNDGPSVDESTTESYPYIQHGRGNILPQPVFGMRMNNPSVGSLTSWYSPGTTYSAVTTPVALPDISILGAPGPHNRVLGGPAMSSPYNPDFYRGSVLSSSPAMPFQYPAVFPYGTSFPLPTSSFSGGSSAYMDPSTGGRYCTPVGSAQLVGTASALSSQYLRPCVVSRPDISSNGAVESSSQKWGRHGLDLNSGPLGLDAEGKDETLHMASRQLPAVNPQALMDEQARSYQLPGGVLKRKEPEGGWGTDREDGEDRKRIRHMWSVASRGSAATVGVDLGSSSSVNSFVKDGRKITVGDCALFKPPNDSPPFIGFIRSLSLDKDNNLKLRVNWLYRPAEVVLGKGVALEAAPNEVFYSFHRDETLAASLLHPCKVAFLPKGVELPSGVSSFVCRRVYDITNKCLWWLTDKDYINDRQEEVDQLLQRSRSEMHPTVQQHQGTNSPRSVNGVAALSPLKHSPDSMQNNGTYASHPKGKKRDLGDQAPEPMKRERLMKDGDIVLSRSESNVKSELTKITDKGGLIDFESVEKLVQLMQAEKLQKKADFSCRSMIAGIIACTDKLDCLNHFVQLRGLPVLDEWLQEVHKGKVGDSGSPKDGEKAVEDFLLVLLRALDRLPVNLNALQMCNIGKSVNNLRSHKNFEIQKKSRSLVDTWKKRVELEMNMNDTRPTNQHIPWHGRSRNDVSHGGNKHPSGSSDISLKSSGQLASTRSGPLKSVQGDTTPRAASVPIATQKTAVSMPLTTTICKDGQVKISSTGSGSELPHTAVKEEKSSSSSQSHTNSQCSSDYARNNVRSGKEDAKCSTAWSKNTNKTIGSSRNRKTTNGPQVTAHSGLQKDLGSNRNSSLPSILPPEKFSDSTISCENNGAAPVAESNSHKIIVKIPNRGRSPGQVANTASMDDSSCKNIRSSSPAHSVKHDQADAGLMEKNNSIRTKIDMIPAALPDVKKCSLGNTIANVPEVSNGVSQSTENDSNAKRSVDSSMSSMNALIDSCVKFSEPQTPISVGDDSGMNLLASVATGEIMRSGASSPEGSPARNSAIAGNGSVDIEVSTLCNDGEPSKPSISNEDPQQNGDPFSKNNGKLDECSRDTSFSASTACIADVGPEQIQAKGAVKKEESHDSVSCKKLIANNHSLPQDQNIDGIQCKEVLNEDEEDSVMHLSSICADKNNPDQGQTSNASIEQSTCLATNPGSVNKEEGLVDSSCVCKEPDLEHSAKQITETTNEFETCNSMPDVVNKRIKLEKTAPFCSDGEEVLALGSVGFQEKDERKSGILESKEKEVESQLSSKIIATTDNQVDRKDECISRTANASSSSADVSGTDKKLEFDLNEGFDMDDLKNGEPTTMVSTVFLAPVSLFGASQSAIPLTSSGLPASVTVASAAKRPFVPPEDLLRNKSELGWKGSAATSAFRPAEPRKVLEIHPVSSKASVKEFMLSKPVRAFLDIDLNVTDEMGLEDMGCHDSANGMDHNPDRRSGVFELDLNKADESPETGYRPAVNFQRFEVPFPPLQPSTKIVNGHSSTKRNFDLNDGPAVDESTVESSIYNQHGRGNIPPQHATFGMRMNNSAVGSLSPWYAPGTTYSAITTPVALPDMSILGAPGSHRAMGAPTTASPFNADFYRGSVLSSSPAMPFASTPFQYPTVFPFGTSFPLPTSSLSGGSAAYMDPSNGGRFCTPAAVSNQYLRPCVVSLPDVSSNGVVESSQKWGRRGLDLNSGPLGVDAEGKDEALLNASRQLPAVNSQALMDDQARGYQVPGGVLKRKEPEGGWDRFSYKQPPSWQ